MPGRLLVALLVALAAPGVAAAAGPVLVGERTSECRAALAMAKERFAATSPTLTWPLPDAERTGNRIVLAAGGEDLSGGDALVADGARFGKSVLTKGEYRSFAYIERTAGRRIVLLDSPHGWRGDLFDTFIVDAGVDDAEILRSLASDQSEKARGFTRLAENEWLPPLVLREGANQRSWLIERGPPWEALADWTVFLPATRAGASPCRVRFSTDGRVGLALLPPPVRRLATALDAALGPGRDEGTLHPTARIRITVALAWANIAARPWALTDRPYNSRAEVDRHLARWARRSPAFARVAHSITRSIAPAEAALGATYRRQVALSAAEAGRAARFAIDHAIRSHFVIAREGAPPDSTPNPWPTGRR